LAPVFRRQPTPELNFACSLIITKGIELKSKFKLSGFANLKRRRLCVLFFVDTFFNTKILKYYIMFKGIKNSKAGVSSIALGVLVAAVSVLLMVILTLFMGNNLSAMSITLISGMLTVLAVLALTQVIRKAFTS